MDPKLKVLLKWHGIKSADMGRKPWKLSKWEEICSKNIQPPPFERWTAADEAKLEETKKLEIDINDTVLGRKRENEKVRMRSVFAASSREEREVLLKEWGYTNERLIALEAEKEEGEVYQQAEV